MENSEQIYVVLHNGLEMKSLVLCLEREIGERELEMIRMTQRHFTRVNAFLHHDLKCNGYLQKFMSKHIV